MNDPKIKLFEVNQYRTWFRWMLGICFLAFSLSAISAPKLSYTFQRLSPHKLQIQLSFLGGETRETVIILPDTWGEKKQLYEGIQDLTVISKSARLKGTSNPAKKIIIHDPSEQLTIQYTLTQRFKGMPKKTGDGFEPVIQRHAFYFIGSNALIFPHIEDSALIDVSFKWRVPSHWSIADSFGMNQKNQNARSTIRQLKDALFMAGDIQLKKIEYEHTDFWIATVGQFTQLNLAHYFEICAKLVHFQQGFWKDPGHYRLLALVSLDSTQESFRGSGLYRSFLITLPQNATMNIGFGLPWLTAHELFHAWNRPDNYAILPDQQEEAIYWLSEGFTDYYALESLLRTNIYPFKAYLDAYNQVLNAYYTSPVRAYTNQEIEQYFWVNEDVDKLPYQRGIILAHRWNREIIRQSHHRYTLDDFFREIQPKNTPRSLDEMDTLSKKYLSHGIKKDIQQYIDEGRLIAPEPDIFGARAKLVFKTEKVRLSPFPVIFDSKTHIITFVLKDSQAAKAGLRVGDEITHLNYKKDDPKTLVRVVIKRGEQSKTIQFMPDKVRYVQVPQFLMSGEN